MEPREGRIAVAVVLALVLVGLTGACGVAMAHGWADTGTPAANGTATDAPIEPAPGAGSGSAGVALAVGLAVVGGTLVYLRGRRDA